jgi:hypothetical protein
VNGSESLFNFRPERCTSLGRSQIRAESSCAVTDQFDEILGGLPLFAKVNGDTRPGRSEPACDGSANSAASPGHQDRLSREIDLQSVCSS